MRDTPEAPGSPDLRCPVVLDCATVAFLPLGLFHLDGVQGANLFTVEEHRRGAARLPNITTKDINSYLEGKKTAKTCRLVVTDDPERVIQHLVSQYELTLKGMAHLTGKNYVQDTAVSMAIVTTEIYSSENEGIYSGAEGVDMVNQFLMCHLIRYSNALTRQSKHKHLSVLTFYEQQCGGVIRPLASLSTLEYIRAIPDAIRRRSLKLVIKGMEGIKTIGLEGADLEKTNKNLEKELKEAKKVGGQRESTRG
jgi:hypothetical protein